MHMGTGIDSGGGQGQAGEDGQDAQPAVCSRAEGQASEGYQVQGIPPPCQESRQDEGTFSSMLC